MDLGNILECCICLNPFTRPKVLSCQHTYCYSCLLRLVGEKKSVACPQCQQIHKLRQTGVQGLPDNLTIKSLLDLRGPNLAADAHGETVLCCDCRSAASVSACDHCQEKICSKCLQKHAKLVGQIENSLFDLKDFMSSGGGNQNGENLEEIGSEREKINQGFNKLQEEIEKRRQLFHDYFQMIDMLYRDLSDKNNTDDANSVKTEAAFTSVETLNSFVCDSKTCSSLESLKLRVNDARSAARLVVKGGRFRFVWKGVELGQIARVEAGAQAIEIERPWRDVKTQGPYESSAQVIIRKFMRQQEQLCETRKIRNEKWSAGMPTDVLNRAVNQPSSSGAGRQELSNAFSGPAVAGAAAGSARKTAGPVASTSTGGGITVEGPVVKKPRLVPITDPQRGAGVKGGNVKYSVIRRKGGEYIRTVLSQEQFKAAISAGRKHVVSVNTNEVGSAVSAVPDVAAQKAVISRLLETPFHTGDVWLLVDAIWFNRWKKYVAFDCWESNVYPGPIDNGPILGGGELRDGLIPELDYVLLPQEAWDKLVSWYTLTDNQQPIRRRVIEQGMFVKQCKVEVYLMDLKLARYSDMQNVTVCQFSRVDTVGRVERKMRELFNISETDDARVWSKFMTDTYECLDEPERTLQDVGIYHGQSIFLEQRMNDGRWPREIE